VLSDPKHIRKMFAMLRESLLATSRETVKGIAEAAADDIRSRIEQQNVKGMGGLAFGRPRTFSTPLNPFTLREKAEKGQDSRTLIATGAYLNSIGAVKVTDTKKKITYRVGYKQTMHPGGLPMSVLGRILEYGAKIEVTPKMRAYLNWKGLHLKATTKYIIIPSRPHFQPTRMDVKRHLRRLVSLQGKKLVKGLKKQLKAAR